MLDRSQLQVVSRSVSVAAHVLEQPALRLRCARDARGMLMLPLVRKYFTLKSPHVLSTSAPLVRNRPIGFASERFLQLFILHLAKASTGAGIRRETPLEVSRASGSL